MVFKPFIHNGSNKNWAFGRSGLKGSRFPDEIGINRFANFSDATAMGKHHESVNL